MPIYTAVAIRDLREPYWTLMREPPAELLRAEYHFETRPAAEKEAARLTVLLNAADG